MSKRTPQIDIRLSNQPTLFDTSTPEGIFDVLLGMKQCMSRDMQKCGVDRYHLAAQISRLTRRDLSKDMLDKYVSSDPAYRPTLDMLTAYVHVTGSYAVPNYLLEPLDASVLRPEDKDLFEMARLQEQRKAIDARILEIAGNRGIGSQS
jgi:hypothetical protein